MGPILPRTASSSKWIVLIAACLGLGMLMIDMFVVNVALPAIGRDLDASLSSVQWTVTSYVLVVGVLPLTAGRLADIFGRRRVYVIGLAVFVAGSGLAGASQEIWQLIAFRVLQGAGAAVMMPATLAIVTSAFPEQQRGLAIGIWGGVSGLGLIAGPILGGVLVHGNTWQWVFLINVPIGLAAIALALAFVPESRDDSASREIDWPGLVLVSGGLALVLLAFTRANEQGWVSPEIAGSFAAGSILLVLFVAVELHAATPLVDLALFRNRTFVAACTAAFLFNLAVFGSQPYMSLFMQNYWGFSPLQAGFAFVPATVLVAALMPVSGMVGQRLGSRLRLMVAFGSLAVLLSSLYLLRLTTESGYVDGLLPSFLIRGLGIGTFMSVTSFAVVSSLPLAKAGLASGTLTMSRNLGTAAGVAVLGAVYVARIHAQLPDDLPRSIGPAEAAAISTRAEHFIVPAGGDAAPFVEDAVVDGFIAVAVATSIVSAVAAGAAMFMRRGYRAPSPQPAPPAALLPPPAGEPTPGS
ncbi:MAG: MFS transporter [Dehalococcoidia bacterium]